MAISKSNWKTFKGKPVKFLIAAFGGEEVTVKPISAKRCDQISRRFASDDDGKLIDPSGYQAALIAEMVTDDTGEPVFTEDELNSDDIDAPAFRELAKAVLQVLGVSDNPKNV